MVKGLWLLGLLVAQPALAQDYTIIALSHTDNKISEIDPGNGRTLREFVIPREWYGEPHEAAISPDARTLYVSVPYAKQVLVLDLETFEQTGVIESEFFSRPAAVRRFARIGERASTSSDPHGLALNRDGSKLYITAEFAQVPGIVVYDVASGTVVNKIDTVIAGNYLWVHPTTGRLYYPARNDDDSVVVIDTHTDSVVDVIEMHDGSRPAGVDFGGPRGEVWINGDGDGSVTVIDPDTHEVIDVLRPPTEQSSGRVAVSPDGRYVAATHGREVSVIDAHTREVLSTLRTTPDEFSGHGFPLFSPDSNTLHIMNEGAGDLVTFDLSTMTQIGEATPLGGASFGGGIRRLRSR